MNYTKPPDKERFYDQVWVLVRQIPNGRVATYGQIAKLIPQPADISDEDYRTSAARWVGLAMAECPADVPWHRVINSQGKISQRTGAGQHKALLESEGVLFANERINLKLYQWSGSESEDELRQGELF